MKKRISLLFLIALLILALTACGGGSLSKPKNGTYKADSLILAAKWTFSGSNEVTISNVITIHGTYKISGDTITVTSSLLGVETTTSYKITEITSKSFFIDGTKFIKQ